MLWTISTKRKMHICTVTFTSWCWQWGRGFFPIATLDKPPLWASVWSENWEDCVYLKLVIGKVAEHHFQHDNCSPKKSVLVLKDHESFVHYKNPTGSRALGDEKMKAAKKGGKKPSQNLGLAKSSFFPSPKGNRNVQIHWWTSMITYQLADNPHFIWTPDLWE